MPTALNSHDVSVSGDLETARALFAVGDYADVLGLVQPIIERGDNRDRGYYCDAVRLRACVESERGQYAICLKTLALAGPFVDDLPAGGKAKFYGQRALAKRNLNDIDGALVDYEAARYWANEAGEKATEASVRNNLAKVYSDAGRVDDALLEVDTAIKLALRLGDDINLGRYYDLKAQVLADHNRYVEALNCSKKAISLLSGLADTHTALIEARLTHGRALVGLGAQYLDSPDLIERFRARRGAAELVQVALTKDLVKLALDRSGGRILGAAQLLEISHSLLIRIIKKHDLARHPERPRRKPLIKK